MSTGKCLRCDVSIVWFNESRADQCPGCGEWINDGDGMAQTEQDLEEHQKYFDNISH